MWKWGVADVLTSAVLGSAMSVVARLARAWVLCVVLSCGGTTPSPTSVELHVQGPTATASLADWRLTSVSDIGFVTVALLEHDSGSAELSLYDVRKEAPKRVDASARVWRSEAPLLASGAYVVSRFDRGNYNRLGGTFGSFSKLPSAGDAQLIGGSSGLRFRYRRAKDGFAGLWLHLFDDRALPEERTYLHTGAASHLTFEIRGSQGGESLTLAVADREWLEKGDARTIGDIGSYLPTGRVGLDWQLVLVPLSDIPPEVEHEELASLVLKVNSLSAGEVSIRNLGLLASSEARLPLEPAPTTSVSRKRSLRRAMWVWKTEAILADDALRERLLATCAANSISDVFLQVVGGDPEVAAWDAMLGLVADLHAAGVRVEALDGSPKYSKAEHHDSALGVAKAVVQSNRSQSKARQFDGLRFDIEPYLLPGFSGPAKHRILQEYLALLDKLHKVAKAAGLPLGADIPFWFDGFTRYHEPIARVAGRPVSELVMDRVDNVAVMAYRTRVYGPDGVIAHAIDEVEYAESTGKAVFIGLETGPLPNEHVREFVRSPRKGADRLLVWPEGRGFRLIHVRAADSKGLAAALAAQPRARGLYLRAETIAPASKITFNRKSAAQLEQATLRIVEELGPYDATVGVAIHAFGSLHTLGHRSSDAAADSADAIR